MGRFLGVLTVQAQFLPRLYHALRRGAVSRAGMRGLQTGARTLPYPQRALRLWREMHGGQMKGMTTH
jgi:hypothetical protein